MSAAKSTKKSVTNRAVPVALTAESLAGVQVFRRLSAPNRGKLAALCQGRRYAAQQRVLSHKDDSQDVYFIISGKVRVTIYSLGGKEITFRDQAAGEMFGELGAIDGEPRSAHVMALEDSLLASMSREKFWGVLGSYPEVAEFTLKRLATLVRLLSEGCSNSAPWPCATASTRSCCASRARISATITRPPFHPRPPTPISPAASAPTARP